MNTQIIFNQSELALAAYATLNNSALSAQKASLKDAGLSDAQATTFASRYAVLTQFNDTPAEGGMGTSFSATVFKDASGNLTLAIRGTLEAGDFLPTDANIAVSGVGYDQVVAMWNWWQRVSTPAGTMVAQYRLLPFPINPSQAVDLNGLWLEATTSVAATGTLISAVNADGDRKLDITGHSLGGHLAMAFGSLFGGQTATVTTFNAPGFKTTTANQNFFAKLGGGIPSGVATTNVIADEANVGTAPWSAIAGLHSRPGVALNVAIENQFLSGVANPPAALNHSQQVLTDSLALYSLFQRIEATVLPATLSGILKAASSTAADSLEQAVWSLGKLYNVVTGHLTGDRNIYYIDVATINTAVAANTNAFITSLIAKSAADMVAQSKTDIAYRYALQELNAFAVTGNAALYTVHNATGELNLYDPATGSGNLTDMYLADRAAMLAWRLKVNLGDLVGDIAPNYQGDPWHFKDVTSGKQVWVGNPYDVKSDTRLHEVIFGQSSVDTLNGSANADHLYGGAGSDTLNGGAGADYIEGQLGDDTLKGEDGGDILYGGQGNDTLDGGAGNDWLDGGLGNDTYLIKSGEGVDVIVDTDGLGKIMLNGIALTGGKTLTAGGTNYLDTNNNTYSLSTDTAGVQTLTINGNLIVKNFSNNALGISLDGAAIKPILTPAVREIIGDFAPIDADLATAGIQFSYDDLGNVVTNPAQPTSRADTLNGSAGADHIVGGLDKDSLYGKDGADNIDGGADQDVLDGGAGNDILAGGSAGDIIVGGIGDDWLYADVSGDAALAAALDPATLASGLKGDWMTGGGGKNFLVGSAGKDVYAFNKVANSDCFETGKLILRKAA